MAKKKVALKDKDVTARNAKGVKGGRAELPLEQLSFNYGKLALCPSDPSLNFKK